MEHLAEMLADFGEYPDGVEEVPACITGVAFFPGGSGLWGAEMGRPLPAMPVGKVMVVGHNFDSVVNYNASRQRGHENINVGSWRSLIELLRESDIAPEDCFFTNAYMGLKANVDVSTGRNISTGKYPGAVNHSFTYRCHAFLLKQIQTQQPRLILTLGKEVLPVLAPLAPKLTAAWGGALNLQDVDSRGASLVSGVQFPGVRHPVTVVALTHPANRGPNVKRRHYGDLAANPAEVTMILDGCKACGLVQWFPSVTDNSGMLNTDTPTFVGGELACGRPPSPRQLTE